MFPLFNKFMFPLLSPEPTGGGPALGSGEMDKDDVIEFLGGDDEKEVIPLEDKDKKGKEKKEEKPEKKEKEKEEVEIEDEDKDKEGDEDEEDEDELDEIEKELEGPTEEQLELVTPVRRREILKKYPQLFKDFPYLEKAYYREQQFTELLPTIDDAKEAVEAKTTLERFEKDLMDGNTELILQATKKENPRAFNKIVDNYLITLSKVDEQAYHHVIGNTIRHTIMAMVAEGRRSNNEALQSAASVLNQFTFGSSDFKPPSNLSKDGDRDDTKDNELKKKEQAFIKQRFESSRGDLNTRVNNSLKNTIDANIDPKQSMTDYVRRTASREALETLERLIEKDTRFKTLVDKLWEKAFDEDFSKASVDRIRSAYFSKAKTLLPSVIKKARNEALKGIGKRVKDAEEEETTPSKGPVPAGRPRSNTPSGKVTKAEDIPRGMSTLDFLNSD